MALSSPPSKYGNCGLKDCNELATVMVNEIQRHSGGTIGRTWFRCVIHADEELTARPELECRNLI